MQRKLVILFMSCGLVGLLSTQASALPLVIESHTTLASGGYLYSYVLENPAVSLESIFDFGIYYYGPVDDTTVQDPAGWSHVPPGYDAATGEGFLNWLAPMYPDGSTPYDLLPGSTLGGFSFESAFGPGPITFTVNGLLVDVGQTIGPSRNPTTVPEPGTLLLLGTGLTTLVVRRRRSKLQA